MALISPRSGYFKDADDAVKQAASLARENVLLRMPFIAHEAVSDLVESKDMAFIKFLAESLTDDVMCELYHSVSEFHKETNNFSLIRADFVFLEELHEKQSWINSELFEDIWTDLQIKAGRVRFIDELIDELVATGGNLSRLVVGSKVGYKHALTGGGGAAAAVDASSEAIKFSGKE